MKVEIESIVCNWADELKIGGQRESQIPYILVRGCVKTQMPF